MDISHIFLLLGIEVAEKFILEDLGKTDDRVQGGAQFMGHIGQEIGLRFGSFCYPGVGIRQFLLLRLHLRVHPCQFPGEAMADQEKIGALVSAKTPQQENCQGKKRQAQDCRGEWSQRLLNRFFGNYPPTKGGVPADMRQSLFPGRLGRWSAPPP